MPVPRICHTGSQLPKDAGLLASLAFDTIMTDGFREGLDGRLDRPKDFRLILDIDMTELSPDHPLVQAHPENFRILYPAERGHTGTNYRGEAAILNPHAVTPELITWWVDALSRLKSYGADGFRFLKPIECKPLLEAVAENLRTRFPDAVLILDTPGIAWNALSSFSRGHYDFCTSSLPWWDEKSVWLAEEYANLKSIAPVIAMAEVPGHVPPADINLRRSRLLTAAITGTGVIMPLGFENGTNEPLGDTVQMMNLLTASEPILQKPGSLRIHPAASHTIALRLADAFGDDALVAVIARKGTAADAFDRTILADLEEWSDLEPIQARQSDDVARAPGRTRLFRARRAKAVRSRPSVLRSAQQAAVEPRIIIEAVSPSVEGGRYAAKRLVGETLRVEASIFTDGHPLLAAEVQFKAGDDNAPRCFAMTPLVNNRWMAEIPLLRAGRHSFVIEAWIDHFGGFLHDLSKKLDAGKDVRLDIQDGLHLIEEARAKAAPGLRDGLDKLVARLQGLAQSEQVALLLEPSAKELMHLADRRAFKVKSAPFPVDADRKAAGFASWYEIFPRSTSGNPARHGTFRDVIAEVPRIAAMGFDVLYLPPIHPIGRSNRKGKNNTLLALPGDVGSVYAIGSSDGGHDAIHPELGSFEDFKALLAAAREHQMEIALDFAIQCSPDHPWLKEHPGWFDWRPDGSIKYAENPPKVYEDIVNVDFYAKDAVPGLWLALRDVVVFWIAQGVRIFRVDNPHTKPFAFWEWLIGSVRAEYPATIFLAEAFARPATMYHLGKIGFSQSYTYFTWRNTKTELTAYITELSTEPVNAFYRPNFFVNTPDINPLYLQNSGRAGFLIRAALAATLSGLWGVFSGFELCEAEALPGREEYLNSDKYEIRARNWHVPENIVAEITQLNRLRRSEPALQSHMGTNFYNAYNDSVLYYGRYPLGHAHRVLVLVNLDPHHEQEVDFEIPLWEWELPDTGVLEAEDLLTGARFLLQGKMQHAVLSPAAPYRIWRVAPMGSAI
ncbi:starch synthase (maltosyl-transferring) [Rhizomicrobium palustre]|uniref:Alpha-1,4-glucan:maltose-1-phosphate maltosyltransferase n=1 Tax=Rhizomicrobium palustre TaxID=189966 RepID=A0A846N0X1_9PROT|nr:starch synthase (maltosyl-transferring) [Rhizomicrobium palustre]